MEPPASAASAPRRLARFVARAGLTVAALLVLAVVLVLLPVRVPIGFLMPRIERAATAVVGFPIRVEGPVVLTLGLRPRIEVRNVRVERGNLGGPGAGDAHVLELGRASLQLGLTALLGRRLAIREAVLEGLDVRVDRALIAWIGDEGTPDESAVAARPQTATVAETATPKDARATGPAALSDWALDIDRLALRDLRFVWTDDDGASTTVRLEQFDGKLDWRRGVELVGSGGYADHDISVRFEGGSIEALLAGGSVWPLSIAVDGPVDEWELSAGISRRDGAVWLENLSALLGPTRLSGSIGIDPHGQRPRAEGTLRVIGLRLGTSPSEEEPTPEIAAGSQSAAVAAHQPSTESARRLRRRAAERSADARSPAAMLVEVLDRFETDLTLEIDAIAGPGPQVRDVRLQLDVSDGRLRFPISLAVAGIPLTGTLAIAREREAPSFAFELAAEDFRVEELGEWAAPTAEIRGTVGHALVELEATGEWLDELVASTSLTIGASEADLAYGAGEDRRVTFERLDFTLSSGGALRFVGNGTVLGEIVSVEARGPTFTAMLAPDDDELDAPWPLALRVTGPGLELSAEGSWAGPSAALDSELEVILEGDSPASLRSWLGDLPFPDAPYALTTRLVTDAAGTTFTIERAHLGRSSLQGRFRLDERESGPHFDAAVTFDYIDLDALLALGAASADATDQAAEPQAREAGSGLSLDIPIVPDGIRFVDAELELTVGEVGGSRLGLNHVELRSTITERSVERSPFSFRLHDTRFDGSVSADLTTASPSARFTVATRDIDIGRLLADLRVAEGVRARAVDMEIVVNGRGRSLGEIVDGSDLVATVKDARWTLGDPGSETALPFRLKEAMLEVPAGNERTRASAIGTLRGVPVKLELEAEPFATGLAAGDPISAVLRLEAAGTKVELEAGVTPPVRRESARLRLAVEGRSTATLGDAFGYELDELGAFKIEASMAGDATGYALSSFNSMIGGSRLAGRGRLLLTGTRPRLDLDLNSERIQIEDFLVDSPEQDEEAPARASEAEAARSPAERQELVDRVTPLGRDGLSRYDGSLKVVAADVRSGEDTLGSGVLHITLDDGSLVLRRLDVAVPGGSLAANGSLRWESDRAVATAEVAIEDLDMGVAARRVDPNARFGGTLSLYVQFEGDAPKPRELLAHGNGKIDFAMAPENLEAGVLDLWVVNLVASVLPQVDDKATSKINCVVAAFDLDDGVMVERALLVDTTTMVVSGKATVDFRDRTISARLGPQPKKPAMFSLQTPVGVNGDFENPSIGIDANDAFGTVVGFGTSVIVVPIQRLISGTLPADGRATCAAAWEKARARQRAGGAGANTDGTGGVDLSR